MEKLLLNRSYSQWLKYILLTLLLGYIIYSYYLPVTLGFDLEDFTIFVVPGLLTFIGLQALLGPNLLSLAYIGPMLTFLAWALTYPILFHLSYTKPLYFYQFAPDYLLALCLFTLNILLPYILVKFLKCNKIVSFIFSILTVVQLGIPLAQIGYYFYSNHCITPATLMALYTTNPQESYEFIFNALGIVGILISIILLLVLILLLYISYKQLYKTVIQYPPFIFKKYFIALIIFATIGHVLYNYSDVNIFKDWNGVSDYIKQLQEYKNKHKDIFNDVKLNDINNTTSQKAPGTIILVIGESASRTYMQAFNAKAPYPNTPWEEEVKNNNPNFIFFNHAYSAYVQTVPVLERALTERNQYEDRPFLESASILDIAKKAGYKTYWFSNQGIYGEYDTAISLVAKTADKAQWVHESFGFSDKYDDAILPLLKEINPNENNFVVIHIMGSHIYYNDRYPSAFSIFKKTNPPTGIEAYSNSLLFTDHVLKEIYTYANTHLHLQAMLYFSDHGESLISSHNPDIFDFDMTRIPLWIYLAPTYQQAFPETFKVLQENKNQYFTNDLLYDLISGLLQAPSNHYNPTRDFSNPNYKFNRNNLTTLLGQHKLNEDINEE